MDLIYRPLQTKLLRMAAERGIRTVSGVEMFLAQGIAQWELWMGSRAPEAAMRKAVADGVEGKRKIASLSTVRYRERIRAEFKSRLRACESRTQAMIQPTFQEFQKLAKHGNLIPAV